MAHPEVEEVETDPVFLGMTRPPMFWGVTYTAVVFYGMLTVAIFIATGYLRAFLLFLPLHAVAFLLCLKDPRIFDLLLVRATTRKPCPNRSLWGLHSYRP